jgi:cell division protein FtsN
MNKFIVGLILGIAIAGGIAYYFNKNPNQFVNKAANESGGIATSSSPVILSPGTKINDITSTSAPVHRQNPDAAKDASEQPSNASAPSYDFYDILQGKKAADNTDKEPTVNKSLRYYIQVGAFSEQNLANDMKARLALMGIEAKIKSGQEASKIINRVLIGPFPSEDATQDMMSKLEAENIRTTLVQIKK